MDEKSPLLSYKNVGKSIGEIIETMDFGIAHYNLFIICGIACMADAIEVSLISFLSICAGQEWNLSTAVVSSITGIIFIGHIVGGIFFGWFADVYGRRMSFLICALNDNKPK